MGRRVIAFIGACLVVTVSATRAKSPTNEAGVANEIKDQVAAPSDFSNEISSFDASSSSVSSGGSLNLESGFKPIVSSETGLTESGDHETKTITITKKVPVPYPVVVEKRVPVRIEVPVDKPYPVYVPRPYNVYVEKKVPYHVHVPVPQPYAVERHVPVPVKVHVDKPYPVAVAHPYPVVLVKKVPYTVEKQIPVPVKIPFIRPYPVRVPVEKEIPYPIEKEVPYPFKVEVERPVAVPVDKPVPVHIEKIVPFKVEKVVPVPYKVPIHIPYKVPVPVPVVSHDTYQSSGSTQDEEYSASHVPQQSDLRQSLAEDTREHVQAGSDEEKFNFSSDNGQYYANYQLSPESQQVFTKSGDESPHQILYASSEPQLTRQLAAWRYVAQQQPSHQELYRQEDQPVQVYSPQQATSLKEQEKLFPSREEERAATRKENFKLGRIVVPQNDDSIKRLKENTNPADGKRESYSKINFGEIAYSNSVQHS